MTTTPPHTTYAPDPASLALLLQELRMLKEKDEQVLVPTEAQLQTFVAMTFWASLVRDEARTIEPRVVFGHPVPDVDYHFTEALPLSARHLATLSLTLSDDQAVAVSADERSGALEIRGITTMAGRVLAIEGVSPGELIVRAVHPFLLLRHDRSHLIDRQAKDTARELLHGASVTGELGERRARNVLLRIARAIARIQHGGTVLVVPAGSPDWRRAVAPNERDAATPWRSLSRALEASHETRLRYDAIDHRAPLTRQDTRFLLSSDPAEARARVDDVVEEVARLASLDGAVVIDTDLNVLTFGATIALDGQVREVKVMHPLVGQADEMLPLDQTGGMRHQSAARFVAATAGTSAIVVSQDGPISVFGRLGTDLVRLTGVEYLLH